MSKKKALCNSQLWLWDTAAPQFLATSPLLTCLFLYYLYHICIIFSWCLSVTVLSGCPAEVWWALLHLYLLFSRFFDPQSCSRSSLSTENWAGCWDCLPKINISKKWRDTHGSQGSREREGLVIYCKIHSGKGGRTSAKSFPNLPFTSSHRRIFQANPSKKIMEIASPTAARGKCKACVVPSNW